MLGDFERRIPLKEGEFNFAQAWTEELCRQIAVSAFKACPFPKKRSKKDEKLDVRRKKRRDRQRRRRQRKAEVVMNCTLRMKA